ncbi:TonB family protein [Pedobacter sp. SYSU D00535]|uniref:TonB family protein n=1 Tax=Pedobacter sp. SYSU D00535 TaxID=2810308 RepID=UPI001A9576DF|nr:TonB family protein [Pedobacter sp. SYSU D00535]
MPVLKPSLLLTLIIFVASTLKSQVSTLGRVVTESQEPLSDVQILSLKSDSMVLTNKYGFFEVLVQHKEEFRAKKKGYIPVNFQITEGENVKLQLYKDVNLSYQGGLEEFYKFMGKSIAYPESAKRAGKSGLVYVTFQVDTSGHLINIRAPEGSDKHFSKEVVRVLGKLPKTFSPVRSNLTFILPVQFRLNGLKVPQVPAVSLPAGKMLHELVISLHTRTEFYKIP